MSELKRLPGRGVPRLERALNGRDPEQSAGAARALVSLGRDVVPPALYVQALVLALADPDGLGRRSAIAALRRVGAGTRMDVARALGLHGPGAVPALVELLRDKDTGVRRAAVAELARLGPAAKDAVPELRRLRGENGKDAALVLGIDEAIRKIEGGG
jgi:HEAT repeat protein